MGAWGTGIFSDDTACDVRRDFHDLIGGEHVRKLPTRLLIDKEQFHYEPYRKLTLWATSERQIPRKRLEKLGSAPVPAHSGRTLVAGMQWRELDTWVERR